MVHVMLNGCATTTWLTISTKLTGLATLEERQIDRLLVTMIAVDAVSTSFIA